MDALSEILKAIHLQGAVFLDADLREGWSYLTPPPQLIGELHMPGAEHIIPYHLITSGACHAGPVGSELVAVEAGDLIVFPHGDRHILASASAVDREPTEIAADMLRGLLRPGEVAPMRNGGADVSTSLVCGYLACDRRLSEQYVAALPRMLRISVTTAGLADWLQSTVRFSVAESASPRPGSAAVLAKLSELLFVEAIRHHIETLPAGQTGWLAGLRDRFVGRALALLHHDPAYPWSVDELARRVGLSRSALAERFGNLLGQPPMQYLTRWRLTLAAREMLSGTRALALIAQDSGYESEAAFNRAFKREYGVPPATWRKNSGEASDDDDVDDAVSAGSQPPREPLLAAGEVALEVTPRPPRDLRPKP